MSELGRTDVEHIADLARIDIDEGEAEEFVGEFNDILTYFDALDEVPDDVEHEDDLENVLRDDEVRQSLSQEEAIRNASETEDGYVRGPRVS